MAIHQAISTRALRLVPDAAYEGALVADCSSAVDAAERSVLVEGRFVEGLREWVARSDMVRWVGELAGAIAALALLIGSRRRGA